MSRRPYLILLLVAVTGIVCDIEAMRARAEPFLCIPGSDEFEWKVHVPERNWEFVVIHHSGTRGGSVESIHREHRSRRDRNGNPWLGIGYHFVVGNGNGMRDGKISPTFRWKQQLHGAHCGSLRHNSLGIGICLIGDFHQTEPTDAQRKSVISLIRTLTNRYAIPSKRILGHRQIRATMCPGRFFPFKDVVKESMQNNVTFNSFTSIPVSVR